MFLRWNIRGGVGSLRLMKYSEALPVGLIYATVGAFFFALSFGLRFWQGIPSHCQSRLQRNDKSAPWLSYLGESQKGNFVILC